jgi:hypothetical protein
MVEMLADDPWAMRTETGTQLNSLILASGRLNLVSRKPSMNFWSSRKNLSRKW